MSLYSVVLASRVVSVALIVAAIIYGSRLKGIKARGTGQLKNIYGSNPAKEIIRYLQTVPGRIDEGLESVHESILKGDDIEERKPKIISTIDHDEKKVNQQLLYEHWGLDDVEGWSSGTNRSVPAETELLIIAVPKKDLIAQKRVDLLIQACAPLFGKCQLLLVGDGPARPVLEQQVPSLRQPGTVSRTPIGRNAGEEFYCIRSIRSARLRWSGGSSGYELWEACYCFLWRRNGS
jgi:hypothetical protein